MKKTASINKFKTKFDKFKKKSDDIYWHFKEMRSKLKSLSKEASDFLHSTDGAENFDPDNFNLLWEYSTYIDICAEDIYGMLFNMKNSTFKKTIPMDKRKKSIFAQHTS